MYEHFEHTADLGLRIRAARLDALFAEAAHALTAAIVAQPDSIEPVERQTIELESAERDDLLHDWLAEILYLFEAERMLFGRFEVSLSSHGLRATAWGEKLDFRRHEIKLEIKAVTYHRLKVESTSEGWLAEVVLDL